ncbi:MAG: helicase-associated domain-containing protein [Anaerolineales bacterium]
MQTLAQTLQDHDRSHLKVIADLWGLDLPNDHQSMTIKGLSGAMLERTPVFVETLPGSAKRALERIVQSGGRLPMEALVRRFGPLRDMGPGKRDRLEPWKEPASPLEMLWYRGLMSRAFADADGGPQEFGFVPDDLLDRMPAVSSPEPRQLGEPVPDPKRIIQSNSYAVDDSVTVLAAHRRAGNLDRDWLLQFLRQPESLALLETLLADAEIMNSPEQIRAFLQLHRAQALQHLRDTWQRSIAWNDLAQTPFVSSPAGDWPNDPQAGRVAALDLIHSVPIDTWWSLTGFVDAVHEVDPGFMRPPGGFDSWYLQSDGDSLHGFDAWDRVEGQYLGYLIRGPMLWLGLSDISQDGSAFRLTETAGSDRKSKGSKARAWPDGRIRVALEADCTLRYQLSRLCEWERVDGGAYHFRLTAQSLLSAEGSGLTAAHAHQVLAEIPAPEGILKALKRWERAGMEAKAERQMILRVEDAQVIDRLMKEPSTRRLLGEQLGPESVTVDPLHWEKLKVAALQLGLLIGQSELD